MLTSSCFEKSLVSGYGIFITGICRKLFSTGKCSCAGIYRQCVASFVFRVARMPFEPMEYYVVLPVNHQETLPQVRILDLHETLGLPFPQPSFIYRLDDIRRVAPDFDFRIFPFYGFQTLDYGQKFHPVVGRAGEPSAHLLLMPGALENNAVSPRPRVAA